MKEDLVLTITMLIFLIIVMFGIQISKRIKIRRFQKEKICRQFGKVPDMDSTLPMDRIKVYYEQMEEGDVDQVTWSDLSMDRIFQRIDQCHSAAGEAVLYDMLHRTEGKSQEQLNALLHYYGGEKEKREKAEKILISLGKREGLYYLPEYVNTLQVSHVGSLSFYRLLQILLLGSIAGGVWKVQILPLAGILAIVNIAVYILFRMKYEQQMSMMELMILVIDTGKQLVKEGCAGPLQNELEERLQEFDKLDKMIGKMSSMRRNSYSGDQGVFLDYLFGITLWQLVSYEKSVKRLEDKQENYKELFETVGRLDASISIVSFRKSLPFYTEPEFHKEKRIYMEEMYHPLLKDPVSNSMDWRRNCIITGSNASGKSTWIKAVGLNLILAQAICTCTARRFQMHPGQILTSMAVRDDIMKGESYFLKEMKYLRRMLQHFSDENLVICIIDEILRGTNTKERIAASRAILDYMQGQNALVMVASHDYELTVLLEESYENYHFTERIGTDDIYFDYTLYPGAVASGNAIRLLKFMEFPEEIVKEAEKQVNINLGKMHEKERKSTKKAMELNNNSK